MEWTLTAFCVTSLKSPAENGMASQLEQIVAVGKRQLFNTFKERIIFTLREKVGNGKTLGKMHSIPWFLCLCLYSALLSICFVFV